MRKILVSACLLGKKVRYDGDHQMPKAMTVGARLLDQWKNQGRIVSICPEVSGGLSVPRPPAEVMRDDLEGELAHRQRMRIVNVEGVDVTPEYRKGAIETLKLARQNDVAFCILKEESPSCGSSRIHDGKFKGDVIPGEGITASLLRSQGYVVFSEEQFEQAEEHLREAESESNE
mmetsp:Transcript_9699/g.15918  ORF Transcript_9699/g.15918 Transcript_9699/m.15918 type:complete len:175 (+) Transcript_9699:1380-1904(+)